MAVVCVALRGVMIFQLVQCGFDFFFGEATHSRRVPVIGRRTQEACVTIQNMKQVLLLLSLLPALAFCQPADGTVQRPDVTLHYTSIGHGDPLIILAGGPGLPVSYMVDLVKPLSEQNRCVLLEQRGTDRSQVASIGPSTFELDTYVEDLEALRKSLHLGQLNILGHSWGGIYAMAYAAKYPDRVHSLVLLSSPGLDVKELVAAEPIVMGRLTEEDKAAEMRWTSPAEVSKDPAHANSMALAAIAPAYFYDREAAMAFAAKLPKGIPVSPASPVVVFGGLIKDGYDLRVPLTAYHGPTLIIQGDHDVVGDEAAKQIGDTIYGSQVLYIPHCGHFEWLEKPNVLFPALKAFLALNAAPSIWPDEDYPVGEPFGRGNHGHGHGGHGHR